MQLILVYYLHYGNTVLFLNWGSVAGC